jgi:hypothetical protein
LRDRQGLPELVDVPGRSSTSVVALTIWNSQQQQQQQLLLQPLQLILLPLLPQLPLRRLSQTITIMGSALTIVNNTDFDFYCNIGIDMAALGIAGIITAVVAAIALIVVTAGAAAAPAGAAVTAIAGATGATTTIVFANIATAVTIAKTVAATATVTTLLRVIVVESSKDLLSKGYRKIAPGGHEKWDSLTLSLQQQGHCIRLRTLLNEK